MSILNLEALPPVASSKHWDRMDRDEQLAVYELLIETMGRLARELEAEFNTSFARSGCTLRTRVSIRPLVDPNDDPRLPAR